MDQTSPFFRDVAMYLRKSRAEEGEDTEVVLERHRSQLTQYAVEHRVNVVRIYEEVVSGDSLFSRPQMTELLHAVEQQQYTGILCMDIDRLGRGNMREQGLILETLKDANAAIITPDKIYDLNDELDETQTEFKTFFARQELKMIKKRLSRGRNLTVERGGWVANAPFGYVQTRKGKIPTLEPNPEESKIVRQIFEWYIFGEGCQAICHRLTAMGVKPHRGAEFSRTSIRKIIENPVYIGKVVWGQTHHIRPKKIGDTIKTVYLPKDEWQIHDGLQEPIIDEITFKRANAILASRSHPPYRESGKILNPFAGLLFCRQCGFAMTRRVMSKGGRWPHEYLLCPTPGCMKGARLDYIEPAFLRELDLKLKGLEVMEQKASESNELIAKRADLDSMKLEFGRLKKQRDRLYDLLEQGVYTVAVFSDREKLLSERINALQADISTFEDDLSSVRRRAEVLIPHIRHVLQMYGDCSPAEKNALLKGVISKALYFKAKDAEPLDFSIHIILRDDVE